jgi:hypothetical protein
MAGIKIINILKDDTVEDIVEHFRQAPAGEVIFVLPKKGKLFHTEEHFALFASEAKESDKTISLLTPDSGIKAMALAHGFTVMHAGKPDKASAKTKKGAKATLASSPLPTDFDLVASNQDEDSTPVTADETMGNEPADDNGLGEDGLEGFQIEDNEGKVVDDTKAEDDLGADLEDEPPVAVTDDADAELMAAPGVQEMEMPEATLAVARASKAAPIASAIDGVRLGIRAKAVPLPKKAEKLQPVPVQAAPATDNLDYIDTMWRNKVGAQEQPQPVTRPMVRTPSAARHGIPRKLTVGIMVASLALLAGAVYAATGSAKVTVTPVSKRLDTQITVQASDTFNAVDATFGKLPGQRLEVTKSATVAAEATGTRDVASKARGKITIHNEYSSSPQPLIATTRFVTDDGKVFRTLQSVTVPGSTTKAGQIVAGTVTVDVIADKPGEEYNVPAGRFTIAAFQERGETERAQKMYGSSSVAMSGGANGPSKVIMQADYDKAKTEATAQAETAIETAANEQSVGLRALTEASIEWQPLKATANPDDAADTVSVTATGTLKTVVFRQSDLEQLIRETVLQKERLTVVNEHVEFSYGDISYKADQGVLAFTVTVRGTGFMPINVEGIRNSVKDKNAAQIRDYFASQEDIESATVTLSPFWVRRVPTKDSRVKIDVRYTPPTQPTPSESGA